MQGSGPNARGSLLPGEELVQVLEQRHSSPMDASHRPLNQVGRQVDHLFAAVFKELIPVV